MKLYALSKTTGKSRKRVGRGLGSGKGKTSGRGTKGQKARGKVSLGFIGGTLPVYKKLPFKRGLGNPKRSAKMVPVALSSLSSFKSGSMVDLQALVDQDIVTKREVKERGVKITGEGDLKTALIVKLPTTFSAAQKIEKAGGKVIRD